MISPVKVWRRQKYTKELLGKSGQILSFTTIVVTGPQFKKYAPYPVVLVKLENGTKTYGQLVDYDKGHLKIGQRVYSVLRKVRQPTTDGVIAYGIKFIPSKKNSK